MENYIPTHHQEIIYSSGDKKSKKSNCFNEAKLKIIVQDDWLLLDAAIKLINNG